MVVEKVDTTIPTSFASPAIFLEGVFDVRDIESGNFTVSLIYFYIFDFIFCFLSYLFLLVQKIKS